MIELNTPEYASRLAAFNTVFTEATAATLVNYVQPIRIEGFGRTALGRLVAVSWGFFREDKANTGRVACISSPENDETHTLVIRPYANRAAHRSIDTGTQTIIHTMPLPCVSQPRHELHVHAHQLITFDSEPIIPLPYQALALPDKG